jgi:hypothetical protein
MEMKKEKEKKAVNVQQENIKQEIWIKDKLKAEM